MQVALTASNRYTPAWAPPQTQALPEAPPDLDRFRPQRNLDGGCGATLLPFGGGERVCLGKALAQMEIRLMSMGLLGRLSFELAPAQDLCLRTIPTPMPRDGLLVRA